MFGLLFPLMNEGALIWNKETQDKTLLGRAVGKILET